MLEKLVVVTLKMVHNGIEYGMMAAIGEGFEILEKVNLTTIMKKYQEYGTTVQSFVLG